MSAKNKKNKKFREDVAPTVGRSLGGGVPKYIPAGVFALCGKYTRNNKIILVWIKSIIGKLTVTIA